MVSKINDGTTNGVQINANTNLHLALIRYILVVALGQALFQLVLLLGYAIGFSGQFYP